ncbi:hypothetical protein SAMN05421788_112200 [Filimonas lacunae]|uniref:Uncharacterized protein n=1 Tax=Filimonas lacunae TaxID=477680 RepID=A0A1N7REC8_9BACT|nr:hypothetical protein SAMN05421788_112200 [Filimonas lacunae]
MRNKIAGKATPYLQLARKTNKTTTTTMTRVKNSANQKDLQHSSLFTNTSKVLSDRTIFNLYAPLLPLPAVTSRQ